jgi:hypothetical protein
MQKDHSDYFIERVKSKSATTPGSPLNPQILKFSDGTETVNMGLTKREYFAAMAMQGYLSGEMFMRQSREEISAKAVMAADALIEALNK